MKYTINEIANSKGVSQHVREALLHMESELTATNRQVEILSDALAVSRRNIDALISLARADEREACAKLCENMTLEWEDQPSIAQAELATMMDCALAIRARGNT